MEAVITLPWLLAFCVGGAVADHRWSGWPLALSLAFSAGAALGGWRLVRRAAARYDDALLGDLLAHVPDAPPWALFSHPVHIIKHEHRALCQRRWGVTTRTSGWTRFRFSWRRDVLGALGCLALVAHAWWVGL